MRSANVLAGKRLLLGAVAVTGLGLGLLARSFWPASSAPADTTAHFVGSNACASCHNTQTAEWRQSQHQAAMAQATELTVLGDFKDATFNYAGITTSFFRRAGKFFVRTDGRDGNLADFEIKYTFGVYPLQQYLVEF